MTSPSSQTLVSVMCVNKQFFSNSPNSSIRDVFAVSESTMRDSILLIPLKILKVKKNLLKIFYSQISPSHRLEAMNGACRCIMCNWRNKTLHSCKMMFIFFCVLRLRLRENIFLLLFLSEKKKKIFSLVWNTFSWVKQNFVSKFH